MMLKKIMFTSGVVVKILATIIGDQLPVLIVNLKIQVAMDQVMLNFKLII